MKADQLFNELKLLAEKLGVQVSEQNFRTTGISVKSGFCKVKEKDLFLIDKHLKLSKKNEVLAEYLGQFELDADFNVQAVREYLDQFKTPVFQVKDKPAADQADLEKSE